MTMGYHLSSISLDNFKKIVETLFAIKKKENEKTLIHSLLPPTANKILIKKTEFSKFSERKNPNWSSAINKTIILETQTTVHQIGIEKWLSINMRDVIVFSCFKISFVLQRYCYVYYRMSFQLKEGERKRKS